jgi:ribosomal protein S20
MNPGQGQVCYDYTEWCRFLAAAHIHVAPVGVAGPVVIPLPPTSATGGSGCVSVGRDLIVAILTHPSAYYFNVHNATFRPARPRSAQPPAELAETVGSPRSISPRSDLPMVEGGANVEDGAFHLCRGRGAAGDVRLWYHHASLNPGATGPAEPIARNPRSSRLGSLSRTWRGARTPQAMKRVRQDERKRAVNQPHRSRAKTLVAKAVVVAAGADAEETRAAVVAAISADKAAGRRHPPQRRRSAQEPPDAQGQRRA